MSPSKLPINQASDLIRFMGTLANAIAESKKDGKINVFDIKYFLPIVPTIGPAFNDMDETFDELRDLTPEETDDLLAIFAQESGLPINDDTRTLMGICLETGADISKLVLHFSKKK